MSFNKEDKNLYEILGVNENSSKNEITKAYTKIIREYHPDYSKNPDIKKIEMANKAYSILNNSEQKKFYDEWLRNNKSNNSNNDFFKAKDERNYNSQNANRRNSSFQNFFTFQNSSSFDFENSNDFLGQLFSRFFSNDRFETRKNSNFNDFGNLFSGEKLFIEDLELYTDLNFRYCCYGCKGFNLTYKYNIYHDDAKISFQTNTNTLKFDISPGIFQTRIFTIKEQGHFYSFLEHRSDLILKLRPNISKNYRIDSYGNITQIVYINSYELNKTLSIKTLDETYINLKPTLNIPKFIPKLKGVGNKNSYFILFLLKDKK